MEKLTKKLKKLYNKNDQRLFINTFEELNDTYNEVYATDKNNSKHIWLFDIQTINNFKDYKVTIKNKNHHYNVYETFDLCEYSYTPFYLNRLFTLKEEKTITKDIILSCTNYFIKEILNIFSLFNISYYDEKIT